MARGVPKTSPPPSILVPKETKKRVVKTGVANFWWEKCWTCFFCVCVLLGNSPAISCRNLSFWLDLFFLSHLVFAFPAFFFFLVLVQKKAESEELARSFRQRQDESRGLELGIEDFDLFIYIYNYTMGPPKPTFLEFFFW